MLFYRMVMLFQRQNHRRGITTVTLTRVIYFMSGLTFLIVSMVYRENYKIFNENDEMIVSNSIHAKNHESWSLESKISNDNDSSNNSKLLERLKTQLADEKNNQNEEDNKPSFRTPIAYGTRDGKEKTAYYVKTALQNGFRHIVTGSHHSRHNETAVGIAWREAVEDDSLDIQRSDIFLQTMFVPWDGADFQSHPNDPKEYGSTHPPNIEDQVKISMEQSLQNLQTDYIDSLLFHNFRAKLHSYDEMLKAWRVLEGYVEIGKIRFLGITNVHDKDYLTRLQKDAIIPISIVQNRFHNNRGFDVDLDSTFQKYDIQLQRFWVLTGNGGGVKKNADMAKQKDLTPEQLMLAFVMSLGSDENNYSRTTALVGTHSVQHMKEDIAISHRYRDIFQGINEDDLERKELANNIGMKFQTL